MYNTHSVTESSQPNAAYRHSPVDQLAICQPMQTEHAPRQPRPTTHGPATPTRPDYGAGQPWGEGHRSVLLPDYMRTDHVRATVVTHCPAIELSIIQWSYFMVRLLIVEDVCKLLH